MADITEKIKEKNGILLYHYIRGSVSQGTAIKGLSDTDTGAVYMCAIDDLIDLGINYKDQVESKKHDDVAYELNKFMRLLMTSNPTMLESLFIDDEFVLYEHPVITEIKKHRDAFITKECFNPMFGFAKSQIEKMRGLNKKINWKKDEMVRKTPLDFCYTPDMKQGSIPISVWLEQRGLNQRHCGLVKIPNMPDLYGLYYDYGQHIEVENISEDYFCDENNFKTDKFLQYVYSMFASDAMAETFNHDHVMYDVFNRIKIPVGKHCGIVSPNMESNDVRVSETKRGDLPICFMSYNENGYRQHCKKYKEYLEWDKNKNEIRYQSNVDKTYDGKNAAHCVRMMNMAIEIASGKGFNVNRANIDRDFLLDIRNHKYEYEELLQIIDDKEKEMKEAMANSTIPDTIDRKFINDLLLDIRKKQIKDNFVQ